MTGQENLRELFVLGLRNAHAMENQALSIMKPQVSRIESYPEVAERLQRHIEETNGQIRRLEEILSGLNEDHSTIKDMALSLTGAMAALGHTMAADEIMKNSFANFAFENFEIAAYKSLITMAELGGFNAALPLLKENLREEEEMATWLDNSLRQITTKYASSAAAGRPADI
jgi:ferritin-like metal-binding protein YciE